MKVNVKTLRNAGGVVLAAVAIILVAGCGTQQGSSADKPVYVQPAPQAQTVTPDQQFLTDVRREIPEIYGVQDDTLLTIANNACILLRGGGNLPEYMERAFAAVPGLTPQDATNIGKVIGIGVRDICPEQIATAQAQIEAYQSTTSGV